MFRPPVETEAHADAFSRALRQGFECPIEFAVTEIFEDRAVVRRVGAVRQALFERKPLVGRRRGIEGNGIAHRFEGGIDLHGWNSQGAREFSDPRGAPVLLPMPLNRLPHALHQVPYVRRKPYAAFLFLNGAADGLTDPPGRVRGKPAAPLRIEFFRHAQQSQRSLLNEIEEVESGDELSTGDRNDES